MTKRADSFLVPERDVDTAKGKPRRSLTAEALLNSISDAAARGPRNSLKVTIRASIAALFAARDEFPEKAEIIETALGQLSQLLAYTARFGSDDIDKLLAADAVSLPDPSLASERSLTDSGSTVSPSETVHAEIHSDIKNGVVQSIRFAGLERLEADTFLAVVGLNVGKRYKYSDLAQATKRIAGMGYVRSVICNDVDGVISFQIKESPLLEKVNFQGVVDPDISDLFASWGVQPRQLLNSKILNSALEQLDAELRQREIARWQTIYHGLDQNRIVIQIVLVGTKNGFVNVGQAMRTPLAKSRRMLDDDGSSTNISEPIGKGQDSPSPTTEAQLLAPALQAALKEEGLASVDSERLSQLLAANLAKEGVTVNRPVFEADAGDIALPTEAPEIYGGLRGPETPPEFVKRVYGEWLGKGLTRAHIRNLDPVLSTAINNWLKKPGCEWPADVDLPTLKEQNSREIAALRDQAPDGQIGKVLGDFTAREAGRIRSAIQRHKK